VIKYTKRKGYSIIFSGTEILFISSFIQRD